MKLLLPLLMTSVLGVTASGVFAQAPVSEGQMSEEQMSAESMSEPKMSDEQMSDEQMAEPAMSADTMMESEMMQADHFDHGLFDQILAKHLVAKDGGQSTWVDYAKIQAESADTLDQYLAALSAVSAEQFNDWPQSEQLAFLINAYNAWTIQLIIDNYPGIDSIRDLGTWIKSPWKKSFIPLLGETLSLDDIEHGRIRAEGVYQDPRIHFAVNCASIGCPPLRTEAFTGDKLDQQLTEQTQLFLMDSSRNRVDGKKLELSSIFKWYRGDFEKGWLGYQSLSAFLYDYRQALGLNEQQSAQLKAEDFKIRFLDYDWNLNDVKNLPQ